MKPLVSCICITQNRRLYLRRAVRYFEEARYVFRGQTGNDAELVILDGSERENAEVIEHQDISDAWYFHEPSPPYSKTGPLHNRACELARGDIIIQWDDDDWQSPDRIAKQVEALERRKGHIVQAAGMPEEGAFCYTSKFWWYHLAERRACKARSWGRGGSAGATFAYHKSIWQAKPFRDVDQGEDNFFWEDHVARGTAMVDMQDPSLVVYIRHNRNGSHAVSDAFTEEDTTEARKVLGSDVDFYDELSEILPLDEWNNPHARWRKQMNDQTSQYANMLQQMQRNRSR